MTRYTMMVAIMMVLVGMAAVPCAWAHCEIPCGIYDDQARMTLIEEHITTIEKSIKKMMEIQEKQPINYNQLVRWVSNKDHHASALQDIVTQYFMTQRITFDAKKYQEKLVLLHHMLVYGMKCKQTTDLANISALRKLVKEFQLLYFESPK